MSKKDEALKLALEALRDYRRSDDDRVSVAMGILQEALAEQGCDYCNHPQYAGTKCKNCGREQLAQQRHISYVCPQCYWTLEKQPAQQEPLGHGGRPMTLRECMEAEEPANANAGKPWVGLTQEDMYEIGEFKNTHGYVPTGFKRLAAAIEAKLREKNA